MQRWHDSEAAWQVGLQRHEEGDFVGAAEAYEFAASQGHALAQINLGTLLDDHLTPRDPARAVFWYTESVKNGEAAAAYNLAVHFRKAGNPEEERHWLSIAASMGDEDAREALKKPMGE